MATMGYTWALEEFDGHVWRVKDMGTDRSTLNMEAFASSKRDELIDSGVDFDPAVTRLAVNTWTGVVSRRTVS